MRELIPFVVGEVEKHSLEELHYKIGAGDIGIYRGIFAIVYQTFVNANEMTRLEDLPQQEKERIWNKAKELSAVDRIKVSKAIYLIEQLLKK